MDRKQAAKQLADSVAKMFTEVVDSVVAVEVQKRLSRLAQGVGSVPLARKPRPRKPCIAPDCKEPGAPRYGMCCAAHDGSYTHEQKLVLRDRARQPGGKWNPGVKKESTKKANAKKANPKKEKSASAAS